MKTPLLDQIRSQFQVLSRSEQRVAERILERPHAILDRPVSNIAEWADVSEPTVIRLCKRLGYRGLRDFKLALARSLATDTAPGSTELASNASLEELAAKVLDRQIATLINTRNHLPHERLEQAISLLAGAGRIELYGHGASGRVAADAQQKFFRLGMPVAAYNDAHDHVIAATVTPPDTVIIAISYTGCSRDLLDSLEIAKDRGITIIGITTPGTPLAELATISLYAEVDESTDIYAPMLSRLAHLALLDVLAVGVALRGGQSAGKKLTQIQDSLTLRRENQPPPGESNSA